MRRGGGGKGEWMRVDTEYEESLQKKATAAGFDRPIDYVWHEREKNPRYCRISYEKYKKRDKGESEVGGMVMATEMVIVAVVVVV
ncbi:hypothetical protein CsSME_00000125 [Camellia sinensis var. sinensis]